MKTKQEQIKDLKEATNLLRDAYRLQNRAMCIMIENYEINNEEGYIEILRIKIDTHKALDKAELMCDELCMKLEEQIKEQLNNK